MPDVPNLNDRQVEFFLRPFGNDAIGHALSSGFTFDTDQFFRTDGTLVGTSQESYALLVAEVVSALHEVIFRRKVTHNEIEAWVQDHIQFNYRRDRNGVESTPLLRADTDRGWRDFSQHGFPPTGNADHLVPEIYFHFSGHHFRTLPRSLADLSAAEVLYEGCSTSRVSAGSVASSRRSISRPTSPPRHVVAVTPLTRSTSKPKSPPPTDIIIESVRTGDEASGVYEEESFSASNAPTGAPTVGTTSRWAVAARSMIHSGMKLFNQEDQFSPRRPRRPPKHTSPRPTTGATRPAIPKEPPDSTQPKDVQALWRGHPIHLPGEDPCHPTFYGASHPRVPHQPYVTYTPGDQYLITVTGCAVNLEKLNSNPRHWMHFLTRLPSNPTNAQVYSWFTLNQPTLCAYGIFVPPWFDFYQADADGFDYKTLFPLEFHPDLQIMNATLFTALKAYALPDDDARIAQFVRGAASSGYSLLAMILQEAHPKLGWSDEDQLSMRFDAQSADESFGDFCDRVTYHFALKHIETPDAVFSPHRVASFIIDHVHGTARREYMRTRFEQEWYSNNSSRKRSYTTEAKLFLRLGQLFDKAPAYDPAGLPAEETRET
jgi:hypothetical protein